MSKVEFPFTRIGKTKLGKIYRPHAKVKVASQRIDGWIPETTLDVGGSETIYLLKKGVRIRTGKWVKNIPLGFFRTR